MIRHFIHLHFAANLPHHWPQFVVNIHRFPLSSGRTPTSTTKKITLHWCLLLKIICAVQSSSKALMVPSRIPNLLLCNLPSRQWLKTRSQARGIIRLREEPHSQLMRDDANSLVRRTAVSFQRERSCA